MSIQKNAKRNKGAVSDRVDLQIGKLIKIGYGQDEPFGYKGQHPLEHVRQLPVQIVSPTTELILRASEIKAEYAISHAGGFAVATALGHSAAIATGDLGFKKVEHLAPII